METWLLAINDRTEASGTAVTFRQDHIKAMFNYSAKSNKSERLFLDNPGGKFPPEKKKTRQKRASLPIQHNMEINTGLIFVKNRCIVMLSEQSPVHQP
jgi:hypothetical protein